MYIKFVLPILCILTGLVGFVLWVRAERDAKKRLAKSGNSRARDLFDGIETLNRQMAAARLSNEEAFRVPPPAPIPTVREQLARDAEIERLLLHMGLREELPPRGRMDNSDLHALLEKAKNKKWDDDPKEKGTPAKTRFERDPLV